MTRFVCCDFPSIFSIEPFHLWYKMAFSNSASHAAEIQAQFNQIAVSFEQERAVKEVGQIPPVEIPLSLFHWSFLTFPLPLLLSTASVWSSQDSRQSFEVKFIFSRDHSLRSLVWSAASVHSNLIKILRSSLETKLKFHPPLLLFDLFYRVSILENNTCRNTLTLLRSIFSFTEPFQTEWGKCLESESSISFPCLSSILLFSVVHS